MLIKLLAFLMMMYITPCFGQLNIDTVKKNLIGIWQDTQDDSGIMVISQNNKIYSYYGNRVVGTDSYALSFIKCDSGYSPITDGRKTHIYLEEYSFIIDENGKKAQDSICNEIDDCDEEELTLLYTAGRLNSWNKLKKMPDYSKHKKAKMK